jgi:hypothetical protein
MTVIVAALHRCTISIQITLWCLGKNAYILMGQEDPKKNTKICSLISVGRVYAIINIP